VKTKQKILNAALTILMENGFQALTQTRIAETAGVSQGNLTYHFPTRTDLLKSVVEETKVRMAAIRSAELEGQTLTWATLEEMMMNIPLSKNMPQLMLALTVARDEDPSLAEWFANHHLTMSQHFRSLLAKLGFQVDDAVLHFVRTTLLGAALIHLQQNSKASEEIVRGVMKNACDYLKQHATPLSS
jgi:AcrR family transcriptional regulator